MKRNAYPVEAERAVAKYREFNRFDPHRIVVGPESFRIPEQVYLGGPMVFVTYRSGKVDPETLRRPSKPQDYIHSHDAGVRCYFPNHADADDGTEVDVPRKFQDVPALARLGYCLGFCFEAPSSRNCEVKSRTPYPDLYTTPDGHCLLVIQSQRTILAMMWGGALGVFPRGIDG